MRPARIASLLVGLLVLSPTARSQDETLVVRPPPPPRDGFETDTDSDGVPDGWYNLRDAQIVAEGGVDGPVLVRFENERPSRPARLSRGFGIDGRVTGAIEMGLWIRSENLVSGERLGEEPNLQIDFLGEDVQSTARGSLGPFPNTKGRWLRVAKRFPIPPATRDAIMTVGLLGGTGRLEIDGLTIRREPRNGSTPTTNLILNGDFEFGDGKPTYWLSEGATRRISSIDAKGASSLVEFTAGGDRLLGVVGVPVGKFERLRIQARARGDGLRSAGPVQMGLFFLDPNGRPVEGAQEGVRAFRWTGSFSWRDERTSIPVPSGSSAAVVQIEKTDGVGRLEIDDIEVTGLTASGDAPAWTPFTTDDGSDAWPAYTPGMIEAGSALDMSFLLTAPAGQQGFVAAQDGQLVYKDGTPARFFGVSLLPTAIYQPPAEIDALADRLARTGINLVRLGDLDAPLGPGGSLIDDVRDDTRGLDPLALESIDYLVAALKSRGIAFAIELQSQVRLRAGDGVPGGRSLPSGAGPAAAFDPTLRERALVVARALLDHVNPRTGLAYRDEPALAWVTVAGEASLFDLIDRPDMLPAEQAERLRSALASARVSSNRAGWKTLEAAQWTAIAKGLREAGLKVPIAGSSHWRREPEYAAAQTATGLDLIDDRLYVVPNRFAAPDRRGLLWSDGPNGVAAFAARKQRRGIPYVAGQWAQQTDGAWGLPREGADLLALTMLARSTGWDGLVRRIVLRYPQAERWGAAASGTGGGTDINLIPESINGLPQTFALLPHAASLWHRRDNPTPGKPRARSPSVAGWEPSRGRLEINTSFTQGIAGWWSGQNVELDDLRVEAGSDFLVAVATSVDSKPLGSSRRILVTLLGRIQPTGLRWVDAWRREVADPGRSPLRVEPVAAKISWKRPGNWAAFQLDNAGRRLRSVDLDSTRDGSLLDASTAEGTLHWELVAVGDDDKTPPPATPR